MSLFPKAINVSEKPSRHFLLLVHDFPLDVLEEPDDLLPLGALYDSLSSEIRAILFFFGMYSDADNGMCSSLVLSSVVFLFNVPVSSEQVDSEC